MNKPNKLIDYQDEMDICLKFGEGNMGAISFILSVVNDMSITRRTRERYYSLLDSLQLYGSPLYMLWNDCCHRNNPEVYKVLDDFDKELITEEQIHEHVNVSGGRGHSFSDIMIE